MLGDNPDVVALWEVSLPDGIHVIDFEHETTSGRRVIRYVGIHIVCTYYLPSTYIHTTIFSPP